jgi:hypothetical protein
MGCFGAFGAGELVESLRVDDEEGGKAWPRLDVVVWLAAAELIWYIKSSDQGAWVSSTGKDEEADLNGSCLYMVRRK